MARRDIQSGRVVRNGEVSPESSPHPQAAGRLEEFSRVAFDLSLTLNRTVIFAGIIAIGAIALIYWGAYTERYLIMAGAMAVFALAILVWAVAVIYTAWAVLIGSVKWWAANRRGPSGQKDGA